MKFSPKYVTVNGYVTDTYLGSNIASLPENLISTVEVYVQIFLVAASIIAVIMQ